MDFLIPEQWNERWAQGNTPWDLGGVTPALVQWAARHPPAGKKILVPGCGQGYDAHFLAKRGARVIAVDFATKALDSARRRFPTSSVEWRRADVTQLPFKEEFDLIWEYTCFCALAPGQRARYLSQLHDALLPGGHYWGLVFGPLPPTQPEPPYGIDAEDFHRLLSRYFHIDRFEAATGRSVKPRRGREIWFESRKR